jgi:hypothetical protein
MKFDKSTKILLNLVLILVIALLVKSLIVVPNDAYARENVEYKILRTPTTHAELQPLINAHVKSGWKLHSLVPSPDKIVLVR